MEKLFVQIFDRKKWIIDQAKHQIDLFDQHLASKLLIDGIPPPIWLWNPQFQSQESEHKDLNKEDLVSGVLLSCPQSSLPCSGGLCTVENRTLDVNNNYDLCNGISESVDALDGGLDVGVRPSTFLQFPVNNSGCSLNGVPDLNVSPMSPQDQGYGISDKVMDPALSLARLQRSKSRQKALELRNSEKTLKHKSWDNFITDHDGETIGASITSFQSGHVDEMNLVSSSDVHNKNENLEEVKASNGQKKGSDYLSGRILRSKSSRQKSSYLRVVTSSHVSGKKYKNCRDTAGKRVLESNQVNSQKGIDIFCGRTTGSRSSKEKAHLDYQLLKLDGSFGNKGGENHLRQKSISVDELRVVVASDLSDVRCGRFEARDTECKEQGIDSYQGGVLGSTSSCKPLSNGKDFSKLDSSSDVAKDDLGRLIKYTGESSSPPNLSGMKGAVNHFIAQGLQEQLLSLPSQKDIELRVAIGNECSSIRNSGKACTSGNIGSLAATKEGIPLAVKFENSVQTGIRPKFSTTNQSNNSQDNQMHAERCSQVQSNLEAFKPNSVEYSESEDVAHEHTGGISKEETACAPEKISQPVNSSNALGCRVTKSRSTGCNNITLGKSLNRVEGIRLSDVSDNQETAWPLTDASNTPYPERCGEAIKGSEIDSDRPTEGRFIFLRPNLDAPGFSVGREVSLSRSPSASDTTMSVVPKQLNFENADVSGLKDISNSSTSGKEICSTPSEEQSFALLDPAVMPDEVMTRSEQISLTSFSNMPLLDNQKDLAKVREAPGDLSEVQEEKINEFKVTSDGIGVSSVVESRKVYEDVAPYTSLETKETSKQNFSPFGHPITLQVSSKIQLSPPKDVAISCFLSTEHMFSKKSITSRGFSSDVKDFGTWPKRQKIDGDPENFVCASPFLMEETLKFTNGNFAEGILKNGEDNVKAGLEAQRLTFSEADVLQSYATDSTVKEMHRNRGYDLLERTEPSPKQDVQKDDSNMERHDGNAHASLTFIHEEVGVSFVSDFIKKSGGHFPWLMEKAGLSGSNVATTDKGSPCIIQDDQDSMPLKDVLVLGDKEHVNSTESSIQEKKYDLERCDQYCSIDSPDVQFLDTIHSDEVMPVYEGFMMHSDDEQNSIAGGRISFDKLDLSKSIIERASILEQICKSACMNTPLSCSSNTYKLQKITNLHKSMAGLLEEINMKSGILDDSTKQARESYSLDSLGRSYSDCLQNSNGQSALDIRKPYTSPVGKLWDKIRSSSGSSGKRSSLKVELPSISEENENTDGVSEVFPEILMSNSAKRVPLTDITENHNRIASEPVKAEFCIHRTHSGTEEKPSNNTISEKYEAKEKQSISLGANGVKRDRFSKPKLSSQTSMRRESPRLSERETKQNNIVSNVTSFIPLVQQKQAAAVKGKRDIKVKALEAAEAAKRLAEKKENERQMKKEALKLERARIEQENLRQLVLQKKKKEEDRKKKEADMVAKKRQREEEERREKDRKRMRVEEKRKQQREFNEKDEREVKCKDQKAHQRKEQHEEATRKLEKKSGNCNLGKVSEVESRTAFASSSSTTGANTVFKDSGPARGYGNEPKVTSIEDEAIEEDSYDISPYKVSDNEAEDDEDDDAVPNSKYIPSWASKSCLARAISSQERLNPEVIFPLESKCNIYEVLMWRKHQHK